MRGRTLTVAAALLVGLAAPTSGRAATTPKGGDAKPDLVVSSLIIEGLGHNPYLVVPQSGKVPDIRVRVTTQNVGTAPAPPSHTMVVLEGAPDSSGHRFQSDAVSQHVHALAPHEKQTTVLTVNRVMPHLGPTHMRAVADWTADIQESNENNNQRTSPDIPAIARTWDADHLEAELFGGTSGQAPDQGSADLGLFFRFDHLNVGAGIFYYRVTGSVTESANYDVAPCSGSATDSIGHAPWGSDSFLGISFATDKYLGVVKASANQLTVPVTCESFSEAVPVNMLDLRIGSGAPVGMYKYSHELSGRATASSFGGEIDYTWTLSADVPR